MGKKGKNRMSDTIQNNDAPNGVMQGTAEVTTPPVTEMLQESAVVTTEVNTSLDTPIIAPVIAPVDEPIVSVDTTTSPTAQLDYSKLSTMGKIVLQSIEDYAIKMHPLKPIDVENGCRQQIGLFRALTQLLNNVNNDFPIVYGAVLARVHELRETVFHELYVFRFFDNMQLSEKERKQFQRLLNLIKVTADPKSRQVTLKQVDMGKTMEFFTEAVKQKIFAFYGK